MFVYMEKTAQTCGDIFWLQEQRNNKDDNNNSSNNNNLWRGVYAFVTILKHSCWLYRLTRKTYVFGIPIQKYMDGYLF